jgi:hypothetical protein
VRSNPAHHEAKKYGHQVLHFDGGALSLLGVCIFAQALRRKKLDRFKVKPTQLACPVSAVPKSFPSPNSQNFEPNFIENVRLKVAEYLTWCQSYDF